MNWKPPISYFPDNYHATLEIGMYGNSVKRIQTELNIVIRRELEYQSLQLEKDGFYGPKTYMAVWIFQNVYGILPTGKADPITISRIHSVFLYIIKRKGCNPSCVLLRDTDSKDVNSH